MDLAIRVNVRYAAPANSQIKDALLLFKSPRWVHSIIRYIIPQLNRVLPAAMNLVEKLKSNPADVRQQQDGETAVCVVCMEALTSPCAELPTCCHQFHDRCIEPWLKMHSTCPTCRHQLPTDAYTSYSVYAINTTIVLQQSQSSMPAAELLELSASNQVIRAIVNARVRRNAASTSAVGAVMLGSLSSDVPILQIEPPVMNASVLQRGSNLSASLPPCVSEPVVPVMHRNASRRRFREQETIRSINKRRRLSSSAEEQDVSTA
ncbi:E3 ubiquitin-protein ligase MPSR1 [Phytophthora citrophthora]|uniref:E3 ubiquitin-protein ligase MPSR1 n=1 Tax=Phytophthora citrophthora TaxID=4793 RepID=A0AAD9GIZ9_9STRA|nr:E3 ubiquitin-protein ligase MPSR1 [Phytophthora citrophthora]